MAAVADLAQARSSAHRALPPAEDPGAVSLLLFYAYREPAWTDAEHRKALAEVLAIGAKHKITGRGRCAPEGLNCTLTGRGGDCLLYTSPSPRDKRQSRMPSSA